MQPSNLVQPNKHKQENIYKGGIILKNNTGYEYKRTMIHER